MYCAGCGQEILNRTKFCPVCGTVASRAVKPTVNRKRHNLLYYSSIGVVILSVTQAIFLNPLLESDFSIWNRFAYMRGIPWFICTALPTVMVALDLFMVISGVVGFLIASRTRIAGLSKVLGIGISVASASLLALRIAHSHVVFRSVTLGNYKNMAPETVWALRSEYLQSIYILFVFAGLAAILSFGYISFSLKLSKPASSNAGKIMVVFGVFGLAGSLAGVFRGQSAGSGVPLVAAWAAVAFGVTLIVGIAGLSKRRSPSARAIWGLVQLFAFTFCILLTIYCAYSAMLQSEFFRDGPFIWIAALSCVLAIFTPLTAFYVSGATFLNSAEQSHIS